MKYISSVLRSSTVRRSSAHSRSSEKAHVIERGAVVSPRTVLLGLVLNSSEFLFVASIMDLDWTGLWERQSVTATPSFARDWSLLESNCALDREGFVPATCAVIRELHGATMPTIGRLLGSQWQPTTPVRVTACVMGATAGFGAVLFLAFDLNGPPATCTLASTSSLILGLALLEATLYEPTTPRFLLSTFVDARDVMTMTRTDTSGAATTVTANVTKVCITPDGQHVTPASHNVTSWAFASHPMGTNANEITLFQAILVPTILHLVNGDFLTTLLGWRGVLRQQPVPTYDFVSGLERRRLALLFLLLVRLPALGYIKVTRLYMVTTEDFGIYCIAMLMVSGLPVFAFCCCCLLLHMLPTPRALRGRAIRVLAPLFMLGTMFSVLIATCICTNPQSTHQDPIWRRPSSLSLHLPRTKTPLALGAYVSKDVPSVATLLAGEIAACVGLTLVVSIAVPMWQHRRWTLDTTFFARNEFLARERPHDCIKYGTKIFAQPSLIALLGYVFIEVAPKTRQDIAVNKDATSAPAEFLLLSMYDLVPTLLPWKLRCPHLVGSVLNYQYIPAAPSAVVGRHSKYVPTKGMCVS
ncbi:hypothetical protein SPRG_07549 [Saprolegnia parasitica CBS 223.65]|uniref:Uncharacterized protein n=1 Tax=Saprolegnia parasitica (strain CBS 223.65) TaxID=695850 RepID=A0A067C962_SAPPC|nr:hypothetical protein SPRG_07549 [Saprolegnia parasitica CBS 223.65]KDO27299.1 hypothetical protein SPRG_07549 [Saprolegnia parasitica CBS 223.65]|eukprot:XP_012202073.1 hypothetical protein SPRG_07549 [Saprolegnia parasitica CBS 223.65]